MAFDNGKHRLGNNRKMIKDYFVKSISCSTDYGCYRIEIMSVVTGYVKDDVLANLSRLKTLLT